MNWTDLIKQVDWEVAHVECDNYGDPDWNYHVVYTLGGKEVWDDYYRSKPDDVMLYNNALEAFKDNVFALGGKYYKDYDEWWAEERK